MKGGAMEAKLMLTLMPEVLLLEKAIESLIKYKQDKYGDGTAKEIFLKEQEEEKVSEEEKTPGVFQKLKDSIVGKKEGEKEVDIKPPEMEVVSLVLKWQEGENPLEEFMKKGD